MSHFAQVVRQSEPPRAVADAKPVRIALIYPGLQASDYWRRSVDSFEARLKAAGQPYVLDKYFTKPTIEVRKQAEHLAQALEQKPDYLVFTLDAQRHKLLIERVLAHGTPKLILQNVTTPLKAWNNRQPFLYVGFDHVTGTRILADHFVKATGGFGDYAVVCWSRGYISEMRGESFVAAMKNVPNLNLKAFFYAGSTQEAGRTAALAALKDFPDLKFIYACSTDLALGVADALRQENRQDRVMVNGWGGGSSELAAIQKGELDVTVMRMNDDNGVAMADAIVLDQSGTPGAVPTVYTGDFALVTKNLTPAAIDDLEIRAFRYSGQ
ncbi:substrate-binding domain-containing protein [Magnetovibrio sp.]|uniref:substrate-binding domain-containing protein n=1 Tax=Magnetovibrio sp. TaxID=2024836 RepID=UPI002F951BB9